MQEVPYDTGEGGSDNTDNTGTVDEPGDVSWMVVQAGTHTLPGGVTIVVRGGLAAWWRPQLPASVRVRRVVGWLQCPALFRMFWLELC